MSLRNWGIVLFVLILDFSSLWAQNPLKIYCIDVNQGSSTLIVSPANKTVLIDAGEVIGNYGDSVYRFIKSLGITHLNYTVATHYHSDHIGGFPVVICSLSGGANNDSILNYCYDRGDIDTFSSIPFFNYRNVVGAKRRTIGLGETINLGGGVILICVVKNGKVVNNDSVIPLPANSDNENYRSIGFVLKYGFFELWIGGDLTGPGGERDVETKVSVVTGDVDIYIANHHGSRYSSSSTFLDSLRPERAIISQGTVPNNYGHPHQEAINRLVARNCYIYQLNENPAGGTFLVPDSGRILNTTAEITVNNWQYFVNGDTYYIDGVRRDGEVLSIIAPKDTIAEGTIITPQVKIKNSGNIIESFPVRLKIGSVYNKTKTISNLAPNDSIIVSFDTTWFATRGNYQVKCSTEVLRDTNKSNDCKIANLTVAFYDAELKDIITPTINDTFYTNESIAPKVVIKDNSEYSSPTFCKVYCQLKGVIPIYFDSVLQLFSPGNIDTITFRKISLAGINDGVYKCSTWVVRNNDLVPSNNVKSALFFISNLTSLGWRKLRDIPGNKGVKAGGALVAGQQDKIYALKGNNTIEFYRYDVNSNSWQSLESMPINPSNHKKVGKGAALTYNQFSNPNIIYATKGNNTLEFWAYDVTANVWSPKSAIPAGMKNVKGGASIALIKQGNQTYVYLLKGNKTNEFYRYHCQANTWTDVKQPPLGPDVKSYKDGSCITAGPNNKLYLLKGGAKFNEFYSYDIDADTWITLESIPRYSALTKKKTKIKDGAALCCDGINVIYAIKGGNSQDFWQYDIDSDQWAELDTIPRGLGGKKIGSGGALCYLNGKVYLLKGNKTFEFWEYTPLTDYKLTKTDYQTMSCLKKQNVLNNERETKVSTVKIYDISGQLVKQQTGIFNERSAQNLKPGIYFIQIQPSSTKYPQTNKKVVVLPK
ncbi:MAG: T9SS type A sorting domain-containing protein [candidate division WOR-3 bacterium]